MDIPNHKALQPVILKLLSDGKPRHKSALTQPLAVQFSLQAEDVARKYESGNGSVFVDRISWSLSHLLIAGLLTRPAPAQYCITPLGREFADKPISELHAYVKQQLALRHQGNVKPAAEQENTEDCSPQEQLFAAYTALRQDIYAEILDRILQKTAKAFEQLVITVLQQMGYGGVVEDAARVTGQSNDGGIDGEIKEDVLGLGRIHIQAKRYKPDAVIGRPEVQGFAGALLGRQSNKGVFITTARFSPMAQEYARTLPSARIILIDGQKLAEYIYAYSVGMQTEHTFTIKKPDTDFWDSLPDEV